MLLCLFVCVEVLRPSQPNGVMSSAVSLPSHLNQRRVENESRKYFIINLHERMLPTSAGVEPATSWSPVGRRIQLSHRGLLYATLTVLGKTGVLNEKTKVFVFLTSPFRLTLNRFTAVTP